MCYLYSITGICRNIHYNGVIMGAMASQITSLTIVYSTIYSDAEQTKHQNSASLAFVRRIRRWPVNSPHKWPVTRNFFSIRWRHHVPLSLNGCICIFMKKWQKNHSTHNIKYFIDRLNEKSLNIYIYIYMSKFIAYARITYPAYACSSYKSHNHIAESGLPTIS